jgi:hypothetical protein
MFNYNENKKKKANDDPRHSAGFTRVLAKSIHG